MEKNSAMNNEGTTGRMITSKAEINVFGNFSSLASSRAPSDKAAPFEKI